MHWVAGSLARSWFGASYGAGHWTRTQGASDKRPGGAASKGSSMCLRSVERQHNKRLKLTAHVEYGMNPSPVRCSLSAIR